MVWGVNSFPSPLHPPEAEAFLSIDTQILMFQDYLRQISSAELDLLGSLYLALPDH